MTTRPMRVPDDQMEDWYVRFKNVAGMLHQRSYGIGCNPKDQAFIRDMLERLAEDEDWRHEEVPILVIHRGIAEGTFMPVENAAATAKIITMRQAVKSRTGLGRFSGVSLPKNGEISRPFRTK